MTHMNITMRNRYSTEEQQRERIIVLETKIKHLEGLLESAESNLASLFERVRKGEEVYLSYPDGNVIYLRAQPDEAGK